MSRSKQNYDKLVKKDGNYVLNFDQLGRITTAIAPEVLTDGPEGPQGEQGPQGEKGEQGVKGDTTSAYHPKDAVANVAALPTEDNEAGDVRMTIDTQEFHVWGGSSWTNAGSIVPVKGDVGPVGPKGEQGFAGLQGSTGLKGDRGFTGEKGEVGPEGAKGEVGEKGQKGQKGADVSASQYFDKGETDARYLQKGGDTMAGRLDINMTDETDAGLRLRGGFAMKMKGETIGGANLFYSASADNSVYYSGIITSDNHIVNKKYVDDVLAAQTPDLSGYYTETQADNLFLTQTGNQVLNDCRLTINNPSDGKATAFVTDSEIYAGVGYRVADNGTIGIDGKPKIQLTEFGGSVKIVDVSAENATKTQGLTLEGYTQNGNGDLLRAHHPSSGYDAIFYYGSVDEGFHMTNKSYVDSAIAAATADFVTSAEQTAALASYATVSDLEAAAPVGDEVLPPILIPEVAFQYSANQSLTSTSVGPADKKLWGFYNGTSNEWIGNWHAIKINKSSFEGGVQPAETTESEENRIIEFYDRNSGNLLLKFVASSVKNYGIFTVIGRRFKMIANAGQATGQNTRGSMF